MVYNYCRLLNFAVCSLAQLLSFFFLFLYCSFNNLLSFSKIIAFSPPVHYSQHSMFKPKAFQKIPLYLQNLPTLVPLYLLLTLRFFIFFFPSIFFWYCKIKQDKKRENSDQPCLSLVSIIYRYNNMTVARGIFLDYNIIIIA